ncbi:MAG: antitoxin [Fusobacteriaceae bacterium]|jgi:hypothetical protein|nr:antitoxin [Fusobacteriaceae bacterium]
MDNLIMTVGTSLVENYKAINPNKKRIIPDDILEYYEKEKVNFLDDPKISLEGVALKNLIDKNIFTGGRIFLVVHDSENGKLAGIVLENIVKKYKLAHIVEKKIIQKLNKRNHLDFRVYGLRALIDEINNIINEKVGNRVNVGVCTVGGYKAEIFIVGLMAQLLHIKSYFMFDEFSDVTEISPFPFRIDYNYYWEHKNFFNLFKKSDYIEPSKVEKFLKENTRMLDFVEKLEISGKEMYALSALGEFYTKISTDTNHLPIGRSSCSPLEKEVILRTDMIPELDTIINSLRCSPYVNKIILTYFNPDRNVTSSRFYLVTNSKNDQIISLEYACKNGIAGIDIYTLGSTEKELRSLVSHFNDSFIN